MPTAGGAVVVRGYSGLTEVARGGDSVVYRARQDSLGRDVAVKVVDVTEPTAQARFARELAITVRLGRQHPHIVTVIDTTTTADGRPCLVMEFHDLGSLHDRLREHGPLPVSEVVAAGTAVADALAFAHAHGVLHRDVKPQNVLLLPTSYVLSDFGIARMADAGHTASLERFSYRHASPQVLDGAEPTAADDVWSLGSTLVTLLTGRAPFASDDPDDDSALAYLRRVRTGQRRPLPEDVPAELRAVLEACLTPDREARTWSAADVLAALRRVPTEERSWAPGTAAVEPPAATGRPPAAGSDAARVAPTDPAPADSALAPAAPAPAPAPAAADQDAPEPGPAPAEIQVPALPSAVAPSALAEIAAQAPPDDEHTSARPAPEPKPAQPTAPPRGNPWTRIAAFIGGALVVGTGAGVLSALLGDDEEPAAAPSPTSAVEVPTLDKPLPPATGPIQASTGDPALAPRNPAILDNGTSVLLTWAEPEQEVDYLLVLDPGTGDGPARVVHQLTGDAQEHTVEGIDPDAGEVCFVVAGYVVEDGAPVAGASPAACATRG
ncbi:protein kinase [Georgenia phoenicis]|uniref:protein kinase domain-containing protein n=1 Tax=unclassified Georgenia TaxID=2626815 RepID=UPI0039AF404A